MECIDNLVEATYGGYFIGKCLRSRFNKINLRPVVGPNLRPVSGTGAFVEICNVRLAENLGRADCDLILADIAAQIETKLVTYGEVALVAILDGEIVEHLLCEWYKALRVRKHWRASVGQLARPLQTRLQRRYTDQHLTPRT